MTRSEEGLTLAEAVIALGIASVVGALLLVIMVNSAGLFYKQSSKVEQGLGINDALGQIRESVKGSSAVAASYTAGSTTYTSSATEIVLKVPSIDIAGNTISNLFDYFIFLKDQSKLRFRVFPDSQSKRSSADQIFTTNADSLLFQYFDSANNQVIPSAAVKVKITLSLKQKAGAGFETNIATSEANLRND